MKIFELDQTKSPKTSFIQIPTSKNRWLCHDVNDRSRSGIIDLSLHFKPHHWQENTIRTTRIMVPAPRLEVNTWSYQSVRPSKHLTPRRNASFSSFSFQLLPYVERGQGTVITLFRVLFLLLHKSLLHYHLRSFRFVKVRITKPVSIEMDFPD